MLRLLRYISLLLFAFLLSGCLVGEHGYIHNRKQVYLQSENLPKTRLPSGLQAASMKPSYPIPHGSAFGKRTAASVVPPGNESLMIPETKKHTLKTNQLSLRQGSNGFLTLKILTDYNAAWQEVTFLLPKQGYQVMGSDSKTGIIEVQEANSNHIYQFSLSQGKDVTLVSVLDQSGNPVSDKVSKKLLTQLKNGLGKQNG